jgi:actin-like protein 6B
MLILWVQVSESTYDERVAASVPGVHYEFPGGYHQDFGPERFKLTECLFEQSLGAPHLGTILTLKLYHKPINVPAA